MKKLVLKTHVNLRYVDTFSGKVPGYRRLYSKGYGKGVRGFRSDDLGPKDSKGNVIGGLSAGVLSLELRHPFIGPTTISLFTDAGNVWGVDYSSTINDSSALRSSMGLGIDWYTPIGPLSFSFSQHITKKSSDKTESFRFNLGTTF